MKKILISLAILTAGLLVVLSDTGLGISAMIANFVKGDPPVPVKNEIVMPPDAIMTASTKAGTITVKSGKGLKRYYSWDGITRSVVMWPRSERWHGSLGLYYPGVGRHWLPSHGGVCRGVLEEGRQNFKSESEALSWIKECQSWYPTVYRDDGLVVWYGRDASRGQVNIAVWQILINGSKPKELGGSSNTAIHTSWTDSPRL